MSIEAVLSFSKPPLYVDFFVVTIALSVHLVNPTLFFFFFLHHFLNANCRFSKNQQLYKYPKHWHLTLLKMHKGFFED